MNDQAPIPTSEALVIPQGTDLVSLFSAPDLPDQFRCASFAAEYLRRFCDIQSRRDLATNIDARARFRILRTEFDAWTGRIASQR